MNPENPHARPEKDDDRIRRNALQVFNIVDKLGYDKRSPDIQARWKEGLDLYGTAFVAYLTYDDVNSEDPEILQRFAVDYVATYPNRVRAIMAFVEDMGWAEEREVFGSQHPEVGLYMKWDLGEIEGRMRELYDLIEFNGQTFLFLR